MCIYWVISLNLDKKLRQNSTFLTMKSKTLSTQKNLSTLDERCTTTTIRRRFKTRKMGPFVKFRWRYFLTLRAVQTGYLKRETIYTKLVRLLTLILRKTITDDNDSQHITANQILTTNSNLRITGLIQRSTSKRYSYPRKLNYMYKRREWIKNAYCTTQWTAKRKVKLFV